MKILAGITNTVIYHGDNKGSTKLDPKLMNNGNNQEGIGIYFGTQEVAETYGKHIIKTVINKRELLYSRKAIGKELGIKNMYKLYITLWQENKDPFYYDLTDWGIEVQEPDEVSGDDIIFLANKNSEEEVRNVQIDLANKFGTETFVKVWNKIFPNIKGTYNPDIEFYAIISTKVKVQKAV